MTRANDLQPMFIIPTSIHLKRQGKPLSAGSVLLFGGFSAKARLAYHCSSLTSLYSRNKCVMSLDALDLFSSERIYADYGHKPWSYIIYENRELVKSLSSPSSSVFFLVLVKEE